MGSKRCLKVGGFEVLFEVDFEARRVGKSLEIDVEAGGIEAVFRYRGRIAC